MANRFSLPLLITTATFLCTISASQPPPLHLRPPTTTAATPEAWAPSPQNGETPSAQPSPSRPPRFRRPPPPPPPTTPNKPPPPPRTVKTSPKTVIVALAVMLSVGAVTVVAMVFVRLRTPTGENLGQMVDMAFVEIELQEITSPEIDRYLNGVISSGNVELATHADGVGVLNQASSSEFVKLELESSTPTDGVGERDAGVTAGTSMIMVA